MLQKMQKLFKEKGQGIIEYGIVIGVAVAIGVAVFSNDSSNITGKIKSTFTKAATDINSATTVVSGT